MKTILNRSLLKRVDELIKKYQTNHHGEKPLYIILSTDESKLLMEEIRNKQGVEAGHLITNYRNIKISSNLSIDDGEFYVSNDLPETGS